MDHVSHPTYRRAGAALAAACAALALIAAGCGGSGGASELTVRSAWARSTPPGAVDGVAYAELRSPADDELVGVDVPSEVAGAVELHESMGAGGAGGMANMPSMKGDAGGAMTMVALDRVSLPAGRAVRFEPGGKHLMLTKLAAPLVAGGSFRMTLRFAHAAAVDVTVEVRDNAP